jgi:hypothetical protein
MSKAELADAVARKGMDAPSTMSPASQQPAMRSLAQQEVQSAVHQVLSATQQEVRSAVRSAVEDEVRWAVPQLRAALQSAAQQEVRSGSERATQGTVLPRRAAQQTKQERFRNIIDRLMSTAVIPIFVALLTSVLVSEHYVSKISDNVLRRGTLPVSTRVIFDRDNGVQGLTWAFHGSLGELSADDQELIGQATDSVGRFNDWMRKRGGIDVDVSFIKLVVTGERQSGIDIESIRPQIVEKGSPLHGTLFYGPAESERENARIGFDLDEASPVAREVDDEKRFGDRGYLGRDYFRANNVHLDLGESQIFSIVAMTADHYYRWYIDLVVLADGRREHVRIGFARDEEQGQEQNPFEITTRADPRTETKGSFSIYQDLWVLDARHHHAGFVPVESKTYAR